MARLLKKYRNEMQGKIKEKLGLSNLMEVPRIDKVTLNMGVGEAVTDKKVLEKAMENLEQISVQKPIKTVAKRAVAGFKIREGYPDWLQSYPKARAHV